MKRYLLWLVPMSAGVMLLVAARHVYTHQQPLTRLEPPQTPARTPFAHSIAATGILEPPSQNIAVGSALSGVVLEVYVPVERVGAHVKKGEPLFRSTIAICRPSLRSRRPALRRPAPVDEAGEAAPSRGSSAQRGESTSRQGECRPHARRVRAGPRSPGSSTPFPSRRPSASDLKYEEALEQWHQAQRQHALLLAGAWKPDLDVARAAVEQAEAEVAQISTEIERAIVRAPIDGQVLQVNVRAGERVSEQSQQALMVLGRTTPLHVRADIDEHDIAEFRHDAQAVLQLRGKNDRHYPLSFVRVEPYVVGKRWLTGDNTERVDTRVLQVIYEVGRDRRGRLRRPAGRRLHRRQ